MSTLVSIVEYNDSHQEAFKALNMEWLREFHLLEDRDLEALDHPRQTIIDHGGVIYIALAGADVVGSAAVIYEHGEYELAKMTVARSHRGKGISKILLNRCVDFVKVRGAQQFILYSNHQLREAIDLYEKFGFVHVPVTDSPFVTADVKMAMRLQ